MRKEWETPRIRTLSISDNFDKSSGVTLEQWRAARDLQALADREKRTQKVA